MKTKDKTDNELIAEFVGDRTSVINNPKWQQGDELIYLKYHKSWDWFMPAYSKFSALEFEENKLNDEHANHCALIAEKVLGFDISGACERLVDGIKWFSALDGTKLETMDREIKFRGYSPEYKDWVCGFLFVTEKGLYYIKSGDENKRFGTGIEVDGSSVGQFTGLKDKNGKEIYGGDVVEAKTDNDRVFGADTHTFEVAFTGNGWYLKTKAGLVNLYQNRFVSLEVIGNIYENPELTKL